MVEQETSFTLLQPSSAPAHPAAAIWVLSQKFLSYQKIGLGQCPTPCPLKFVHRYVGLVMLKDVRVDISTMHMLGLFCSITPGPVPADHNKLSFVLIRSRMAIGDMLCYQYYQVTD